MKTRNLLGFALLLLIFSTAFSQAQTRSRPPLRNTAQSEQNIRPHEKGYRTGYEDGFDQGKADFTQGDPRDFTRSQDYQSADHRYESRMGRIEEYQDGYRVGFELGYNDGYLGRSFSLSLPQNLMVVVIGPETIATQPRDNTRGRSDERTSSGNYPPPQTRRADPQPSESNARVEMAVPDGDQLRIRLTSPLSTKTNREGDRFTARVVSPAAYVNATVVGHVERIARSGKATGKTELLLAFDEITIDGETLPFQAQVEKVYEGATVKTVDAEGNVQTTSRTKDTAVRGAGGAALGAIIGSIAGGGKGAAIGAVIGGAAGAGSVYVQDGKDIIFEPGTEMMIRSIGRR